MCDFRRGSSRALGMELTEVPEGVQEFDELGHAVLVICKYASGQTDRQTSIAILHVIASPGGV